MVQSADASALPNRPTRWVAAWCALAVWLMGLFAVSPELHAQLHAHDGHGGCHDAPAPEQDGHACPVTLFQQGAENPVAFAAVLVAPMSLRVETVVCVDRHGAVVADVRLAPGRGPPVR